MKVKELITILEKLNSELNVVIPCEDGFIEDVETVSVCDSIRFGGFNLSDEENGLVVFIDR